MKPRTKHTAKKPRSVEDISLRDIIKEVTINLRAAQGMIKRMSYDDLDAPRIGGQLMVPDARLTIVGSPDNMIAVLT